MLISFSVENWMSFRDKVTFSMVATEEDQHSNRVYQLKEFQTKVLPIAAIYGGNASGKSNFFNALAFAKELCVGIRGSLLDTTINAQPFLLSKNMSDKPSRFVFDLLIDDSVYEFSFAVTYNAVQEEKLVKINGTNETVLYHRFEGKLRHLDESIAADQFINFAFKATRDDQLFLPNSVLLNVNNFEPVVNWFKNTLEVISPDSCFGPFERFFDEDTQLYSSMSRLLPQLDTGIIHLGGEEISLKTLSLPEPLQKNIREGVSIHLLDPRSKKRFVVTHQDGELIAKKLVTYHKCGDGTEISFNTNQESDGSLRMIDLLPAFLELAGENAEKVYIIDEIDRSLHTLLTRSLLESYLSNCSTKTKKQLLLTTHDVLLMDQDLLRRDEIWLTERDDSGVSHLFSLSDYVDARNDKDIRKSYLQGRMGGIPQILLESALADLCLNEEE